MTMQLVEVTRPDGVVQYFNRHENGMYSPVGGGFEVMITQFKSIKDIKRLPEVYTMGRCGFDNFDEKNFRCLCNELDRWNGWAKPYILAEDIEKFVNAYEDDESWTTRLLKNGTLVLTDVEYGEMSDKVKPEMVNGHKVYNVNFGWCWDFVADITNQSESS